MKNSAIFLFAIATVFGGFLLNSGLYALEPVSEEVLKKEVKLDSWIFIPGDLHECADPSWKPDESHSIEKIYDPMVWKKHNLKDGENSWFIRNLKLDSNPRDLAMILHQGKRGMQVFCNGSLIHETRKPDKTGVFPVRAGKPALVHIPSSLLVPGINRIALRTSSLDGWSGLMNHVVIGPEMIVEAEWNHFMIYNSIFVGIALFIGFFYFINYLLRRQDRASLYFSIFSFMVGTWELGFSGLILYILDYRLAYILSLYASAVFMVIMLLHFVYRFFSFKIGPVFIIVNLFYSFFPLALLVEYGATGGITFYNAYLYSPFVSSLLFIVIYLIILVLNALRLNKDYSRHMTGAMLVHTALLLYSIGVFTELIPGDAMIVESFLALAVGLSWILSLRYARLYSELEYANTQLMVLDRMKDDFMATTSHELRTPLHGIIGLTGNVLENGGNLSQDQRKDLDLVLSSATRLNTLVNEILDFSRIRAGRSDLYLERVDLRDLAPATVSLARALPEAGNLVLRCEVDRETPVITADKNRMEQVLMNLLSNGVRYTREGEVLVTVGPDGEGVRLDVRDTGIGISADEIKNLWNPYLRLEGSRGAEGSGLGLVITRYLVEQHGGRIEAESEPGKGSLFSVYLPIMPEVEGIDARQIDRDVAHHPAYETEISVSIDKDARKIEGGKPVGLETLSQTADILAVDDDPVNLQVIERILSNAGYDVRMAETGEEALDMIREKVPDLVLLDLMLPGMSGYEMLGMMRRDHAEFIPVVMVSALGQVENMVKGFTLGCNDYITKPFNPRELLVRIENQLSIRNVITMEESLISDLEGHREDLKTSLYERTTQLADTLRRLTEWESVISEDLEMSARFLDRLMTDWVDHPDIETFLHYRPLMTIGGDVYDVTLTGNRVRFFIADATGHGINASLNSITIVTEYTLLKDGDLTPAEILTRINKRFCTSHVDKTIIFTAFLMDLDLDNGQMVAASAGHPSQAVVHGNSLEWVRPKGLIVGLSDDSVYENSYLTLKPDSTIFIYTDGLYESHYRVSTKEPLPPVNPEMVGDAFIDASSRGSAREAAENLVNHFYQKENDIAAEDDITLLVCRYLPAKVTDGMKESKARQKVL